MAKTVWSGVKIDGIFVDILPFANKEETEGKCEQVFDTFREAKKFAIETQRSNAEGYLQSARALKKLKRAHLGNPR